MKSKKESLVCLTLVLFASIVIYLSSQFRELPPILQRGLQPSTFPIICAILIIAFAVMIWLTSSKYRHTEDLLFNKMTLKIFVVFLIFTILLTVDFFLSLILSTLAIHILWTGKWKISSIFLLGVILPVFIYILFGQILDVRFPDGIITTYLQG